MKILFEFVEAFWKPQINLCSLSLHCIFARLRKQQKCEKIILNISKIWICIKKKLPPNHLKAWLASLKYPNILQFWTISRDIIEFIHAQN